MYLDLLSAILPQDLLNHFTITSFEELGDVSVKKDAIHIYLEENNVLPSGYSQEEYESKGFIGSKRIQDFTIC